MKVWRRVQHLSQRRTSTTKATMRISAGSASWAKLERHDVLKLSDSDAWKPGGKFRQKWHRQMMAAWHVVTRRLTSNTWQKAMWRIGERTPK